MDTIYHRVLQFRCAETGKKFVVVFTRENAESRFRVVNIIDEGDFAIQDQAHGSGIEQPLQLLAGSVRRFLTSFSSTITSSTQLIQRFLTPIAQPSPEQPHRDSAPPQGDQGVEDFNINDFDFTGWHCPYCGHAKEKPVSTRFIKCGHCHEYVCGSRVERMPDGKTYFTCHNRCGNRGILTEGSLNSLTGLGVDAQRPSRLHAGVASHKLPGPRQALPSGKKDNR